jgi:plastocyanin
MKAKVISFIAALATISTSFMPFAASAATVDTQAISPGDLIKCASISSVYYFAPDGKRYVFPNEKTYFTWYTNFDGVKTISDKRCSTLPLGRGNVTYRPGVKMLKITSDPRTYAVERGGILRHVTTAEIAETLFGLNWKSRIDDVPDSFFSNYKVGTPIETSSQYNPASVMAATVTIMADKSFDDTIATVSIGDVSAGFVPLTLTVKKGTKVTWVNRDIKEHQVKGANFDSGMLAADADYSYTFNTVGSFDYADPLAPTMTAVVNVVN